MLPVQEREMGMKKLEISVEQLFRSKLSVHSTPPYGNTHSAIEIKDMIWGASFFKTLSRGT